MKYKPLLQLSAAVTLLLTVAGYASAFELSDSSGKRHALADYKGRWVVLNFWATWCEPCRAEMPAFERLYQRWAARGVQFLGLSDESTDKAQQFGRALGISYPLWTGGDQVAGLSRRLGNALGGLPHTVVLDRRGEVTLQKVGPYTEVELEKILQDLAEKGR